DPQLVQERQHARVLIKRLNDSCADQNAERAEIIRQLIPNAGATPWIEPPFYCDYGSNLQLGEKVFFNFNCVVLDVAPIRIGSRVLFGPGVQLYAASHPLSAAERASGLELGLPIEIGDD